MRRICFLDMDGVVSDFAEQAYTFTGYDVTSFKDRELTPKEKIIQNKVFYSADYSDRFWSTMKPTKDAQDVMRTCQTHFDEVFFLSRFRPPKEHPERLDVVRQLKTDWVTKTFNGLIDTNHVIVTDKPKSSYIIPNEDCYLIDDRKSEVRDFKKAGGKGILFMSGNQLKNFLDLYKIWSSYNCRQ